MADISIIQANVLDHQAGLTSSPVNVTATIKAGVALAPGNLVYSDTTPSWQLLQCASSGGTSVLSGYGGSIGVCLNTPAAGQPATVQTSGPITIGGNPVPAVGIILYGSVNAGAIATSVTTGQYVTQVGYVISATDIVLQPQALNQVRG